MTSGVDQPTMRVVCTSRFRWGWWVLARYALWSIPQGAFLSLIAIINPGTDAPLSWLDAALSTLMLTTFALCLGTLVAAPLQILWLLAVGSRNRLLLVGDRLVHLRGTHTEGSWPLTGLVWVRIPPPPSPRDMLLSGWGPWNLMFDDTWLHVDTGDRWSPRNGDQRVGTFYLTEAERDAAQRAIDEAIAAHRRPVAAPGPPPRPPR